jgi:hypothetical protein
MTNVKFAVGCLVQWYECEMIEDYVKSLIDSIKYTKNKDIIVDFTFVINQDLEQLDDSKISMDELKSKFEGLMVGFDINVNFRITDKLLTIADYRRNFNIKYCDEVDVLIWGESDSLLPKQMFSILDNLHKMSLENNNPKYLAFFGTCKMWDDTWKSVEHTEFTNKPVDNKKWWGTRYVTSIKEMNNINSGIDELDVRVVSPHKFNGCGLVISSEVIKAGVNIPKSVFFTHEDTAFNMMTNRVLGNIPQYIIKNILLVHNREHPKKRMYVGGEIGNTLGERRKSNNWYSVASKMSEQNCHNIFNNNYKSFNWKDVWENIK